jgi:hypothetical protein
MYPDQHAHPRSLIRIHAFRLQTLLQVEKLIANIMDPDQTARMRRLVWTHAGRKRTMFVSSWPGSIIIWFESQFNKSHTFKLKSLSDIRNQVIN